MPTAACGSFGRKSPTHNSARVHPCRRSIGSLAKGREDGMDVERGSPALRPEEQTELGPLPGRIRGCDLALIEHLLAPDQRSFRFTQTAAAVVAYP